MRVVLNQVGTLFACYHNEEKTFNEMNYFITYTSQGVEHTETVKGYNLARSTAKQLHNEGAEDITITCERPQFSSLVDKCVPTLVWEETYPQCKRTELDKRYWEGEGYIPTGRWDQLTAELLRKESMS